MKKLFSLVVMAMLLVMVSCSESDSPAMADIRPSEESLSTDDAVPYDSEDLTAVFAALDSLNATMPGNVSRGLGNRFATFMADQVGKIAGRRLGGKTVGRILSALSSILVEILSKDDDSSTSYEFVYSLEISPMSILDDGPVSITPNFSNSIFSRGLILDNGDYDPIFSTEVDDDHIGFQHNYAMYEMEKNRSSYFLNDKPNLDLLLSDVIDLVKADALDDASREKYKNMVNNIATITTENYECGNSDEDLIWNYAYYLESEGLSEEDLLIFTEFTAKIGFNCLNRSADEIHSYAAELHELIKRQNLSVEMKVELAIFAQCTVNSALFWQQ